MGQKNNEKPLEGKLKRRFFSDPSKFPILAADSRS